MNFKRIGRMMLCLLLICALLVNISPIRAEASATVAIGLVKVVAAPVIKAASIGLGVYVTDWMVDRLADTLTGAGLIDENGYMEVYHFGDGLFGLAEWTLEGLHGLIWDEAIVTGGFTGTSLNASMIWMGTTHSYTSYNPQQPLTIAVCAYPGASNNSWRSRVFVLAQSPGQVRRNGSSTYDLVPGGGAYFYSSNEYSHSSRPSAGSSDLIWYTSATTIEGMLADCPFVGVKAGGDYEIGYVAPAGSEFYQGYQDWASRSQSVSIGGEDLFVAPIGSTAVGTATHSYTQEDVWTGSVPIIIVDQTGNGGGSTEPTKPDTGDGTYIPMDPNLPSLLERLFGNVSSKIEQVSMSIQEIPDLIREFAEDVRTGFLELPGKFADWFNNLRTELIDIRTKLQQFLDGQITLADLLSGLFEPIRTAVVDALTYLFAPSETFIQSKVESLIAKYPTADTFLNLGNSLRAFFSGIGATAPIIYIDLGAAEGSYFLGGREIFLDLTWYSRYKPTVDAIIGAFIWLWLAWRVFLSIPSIIQGEAGSWGDRKTDIGASNTSGATIVHQRELPSGKK